MFRLIENGPFLIQTKIIQIIDITSTKMLTKPDQY